MRAGFPTPPEPTLGALNLFILNDLLQYICKCAQTHKSTISKKMNLLYVAVDPGLHTHYSAGEAYPANDYPFPDDVDEVPNFSACNNDNKRATAKITHRNLLKTRNDVVNLNAALIDTLLGLILTAFKLLYEQERMMDRNAVFHQRLTGSSPTDVLPPKIVKPFVRRWPPTGTPQWDLRYSPHAYSMALSSRASRVI